MTSPETTAPEAEIISECVFCQGHLEFAFKRDQRTYARCRDCGAYLRSDLRNVHTAVYDEGIFAERRELSSSAAEPGFQEFDSLSPFLRNGNLLEIGCGTGHLLAAARARGFNVAGIEVSAYQRDYIREHWGLNVSADTIEASTFSAEAFDNVLSVNVLEHIPEPHQHLLAIKRVLKPGGRCIISTANADSIVVDLCGSWWPMFKPSDHVSIPSPKSLRLLAERSGLALAALWCSEYPLETPVGIAIALRDRWNREAAGLSNGSSEVIAKSSGLAQRVRELPQFRFVARVLSRLMRAASIKVVYEKLAPAIEKNS